MTRSLLIASVSAVLLLTPSMADCLQVGRIDRWSALDNKTIVVRDTTHHEFKLSLVATCPNLNFNMSIGLKTAGTSRFDCVRRGDTITVGAFYPPVTCIIKSVEPLTPPPKDNAPG